MLVHTISLSRQSPETWRYLSRYYCRLFLAGRNAGILAAGCGLNVLTFVFEQGVIAKYALYSSVRLISHLAQSLDFFLLAAAFVTADVFFAAKRHGLFEEMRLAGLRWTAILAPLFGFIFGAFVIDAYIEVGLYVWALSKLLPAVTVAGIAAAAGVHALAVAYFAGTILLVTNLAKWTRAIQVAAAYVFAVCDVFGIYAVQSLAAGLAMLHAPLVRESAIVRYFLPWGPLAFWGDITDLAYLAAALLVAMALAILALLGEFVVARHAERIAGY